MVHLYLRQDSPGLFHDLLDTPRVRVPRLGTMLPAYVREFPSPEIYRGQADPADWLEGASGGFPNRHLAAQGLFLLLIAERNPAYTPYRELLDSRPLARRKTYPPLYDALHRFFETQPRFGPDNQNLVDMLRSPAVASPDSLFGQLEYIRYRWGALLGDYLERLLRALDFLREEQKLRLPLAGLARPPEYSEGDFEGERYSQDRDWMPHLVLMAKSTLVWLDQLSRRYGRHVRTLDQVPDEELDGLARWGFTGLWLIGIWERSPASRAIKRLCGNPEAESSAYSLARYRVAEALGGEAALAALAGRCRARGIRLASDMVPNHTGLDSDWVREHPDWFVQVDSSPFPGYTFGGTNLCGQPGIGIFLEDHYYDRTDAAVVFRRSDAAGTRFIYHGNDGTHLPWNDTAQLDYLNPEVREAVIQEILGVARRFPIVRFDAAMTLTRRHYQRLWFPEPGSGGRHPLPGGARPVPRPVPAAHAPGVLARGGGEGGPRGAGHPAAGRGLLADGGLLRAHPGHAPGVQQRLHEHAQDRGQPRLPHPDQEHPGVRPADPQTLRELPEQPRRGNGHRPVRHRGQVLRGLPAHGHAARAAHVRARAGGGPAREVRHGVQPGLRGGEPRRRS